MKLDKKALELLSLQRPVYAGLEIPAAGTKLKNEILKYTTTMRAHHPRREEPMNMLDIGCGIGFGLLALQEIYGPNNFYVGVDKSKISENIHYGFADIASTYNNLEITKNTLINNGFNEKNLNLLEIPVDLLKLEKSFDIVTSHIAWGFHFPIDEYLNQVRKILKKKATIIVDIRRGTTGVHRMSKYFDLRAALHSRKYITTVWNTK